MRQSARALKAWLFVLAALTASAHAGHDSIQVDPALRRHAGQVVALGEPDARGHVYSFRLKRLPEAPAFASDELRGWRLTMLAGKRFAQAYEIAGNGGSEVTVSAKGEPLDGVAVKDVFVIENTPLLPSADTSQQ